MSYIVGLSALLLSIILIILYNRYKTFEHLKSYKIYLSDEEVTRRFVRKGLDDE